MREMLTGRRQDATRPVMKNALSLALVGSTLLCAGCVRVQAPDKPIEINLNVNVRQEVVVSLRKDAADIITANPDLFPE
jgi:hypothetical protein